MRLYIYIIGIIFFISCATPTVKLPPVKKKEIEYTRLSTDKFIWPVKGEIIGKFGYIYHNRLNKGIDIQTSFNEEVRASKEGRVVFCGSIRGFGPTVIISHKGNYYTIYANNYKILVKKNQFVKQGEVISYVGLDPWLKKPVLHFEIRKKEKAFNPLRLLE